MASDLPVAAPPYLLEKSELVNRYLALYLPDPGQYPQQLHEAIHYAVMAGGKRLRPVLAIAAYESSGGKGEDIYKAAAALELVHTYSLIHDDLPCMDDDDLRRGRPTLHKKFNEAVALLAGDALHDFAFQLMAQTGRTEIVLELAEAIGTGGMLAGQMADLEAERRKVSLDDVRFIHEHKTGKLIRGALRIGAMLGNASVRQLDGITRYGEKIGLAFQIIDDILDIEGSTSVLGKPVGSDSRNFKATYPGVIGLEASRQAAGRLIAEAIAIIEQSFSPSDVFIDLARFIGGRQN